MAHHVLGLLPELGEVLVHGSVPLTLPRRAVEHADLQRLHEATNLLLVLVVQLKRRLSVMIRTVTCTCTVHVLVHACMDT